jgi:hypothetical protein
MYRRRQIYRRRQMYHLRLFPCVHLMESILRNIFDAMPPPFLMLVDCQKFYDYSILHPMELYLKVGLLELWSKKLNEITFMLKCFNKHAGYPLTFIQ